jgi:hypothetical protein
MGVSGQRHAPAALYPRGKRPRYPSDRSLGGPQSRSGRRDSASVGDRTPVVQSVVSHYTDGATIGKVLHRNNKVRFKMTKSRFKTFL